jgi:TolA-binding protein
MKKLVWIILLLGAIGLSGCSGTSAQDLLDTAKLEEKQNNPEHAKKLYQEIIQKYPNTSFAKEAQERLSVLK